MSISHLNRGYKKPTFLVGLPRAGSTLLQGILCNSGAYFPMPETHFFSMAAFGIPSKCLQKNHLISIQRNLLKKSRIKLELEIPDALNTEKDVFEYVVNQFNTGNLTTFLEKTPRHVFFYEKIIRYYPDALFICIIREPKNVISSHLIMSKIQNKSVIRLSLLYNKIARAIIHIKDKSNVFLIKYEDLTSETEKTIKSLFGFLEIAYSEKVIEKVAAPPEIVQEHEFWKKKNINQEMIQKNNADKWRKILSPAQANIINFITKSHAEKFGYNLPYAWSRVLSGLGQDIPRLFSSREFKKVFSKYHG